MEWLESGDTLINNKKKAGKKGWVKILRATPSFESSNKISVPGFCNRESARETIHYTVAALLLSEELIAAMEKMPEQGANASLLPSNGIGSRFSNLNKSFKYSLRSLLTSCSKEEFYKAFSSFSNIEKELLHRLFLQVITSLHENLEDGFETVCLQTQAGATLDAVEKIVEEQDLDVLFSDRSNIMDVAENLSMAKKNEIQHLKHMVQLGEEHNQMLRTRLQLLKEGNQVLSGASQAVEKFKSMNLNYGANSGDEIHDV
ncbi:hypothetical protein GmHk_02G003396 [Glycine max]|nr:hypothetical protein GmHk_02G003396 [Glycine max]